MRGIAKVPLMAARAQPSSAELRERLRRWMKHYWRKAEAKGLNRQEFAQSVGLSPATISNVLNDVEKPSIDSLAALHFGLGADLREMLREDPPEPESDRPKSVAPRR